jgi:hypothetical protein
MFQARFLGEPNLGRIGSKFDREVPYVKVFD